MKFIHFLFLVLLLGFNTHAKDITVTVKGGMWSFERSDTGESSSGIGSYALQLGYAFTPKIQVAGGINILMSEGFGGQQGFGFDLGANYYYLTSVGSDTTSFGNSEIILKEIWRPYIGAFLRQRTFSFFISTSYVGVGTSIGIDYAAFDDWFLNLEGRFDLLSGPDDAQATQLNILLGAGVEF